MATLAETVTRICDDLSRPEDELGGIVEREVLSAIKFYSNFRFAFNERALNVTLSTTSVYSFATLLAASTEVSDILKIDQINVQLSSRNFTLEETNWEELNALDQSSATGNPDFFATYDKSLYVYPTPTTNISTTVYAHVLLTALTSGDENDWLLEGEELIRSRACKEVLMRKLDDYEKGQVFASLEVEALRNLARKTNNLHAIGQLAPND